jgi:hypothetical protein
MPLHAEKLLKAAQSGQELSTEDRRHVMAWIIGTDNQYSNEELAEIFKVAERTVTNDRRYVREMIAKNIKEQDVGLILADIQLSIERNIRDIEKSKAKSKLGTKTYLDHCNASVKMQIDCMKAFQDLGLYPKNLGTLHTEKFEFSAVVGMATPAQQRPLNMFDQKKEIPTLTAEVVEAPRLPNATPDAAEAGTEQSVAAAPDSVEKAGEPGSSSGAQLPAVPTDTRVGISVPPAGEPAQSAL